MYRRVLYAALWATILGAQQTPPPDEALDRIRARAAENNARLPDYLCAQTVERAQRASAGEEFAPRDTLRLEVALIGGRERYAWSDARKFEDRELRDLVGKGMTGTGHFALHTRHVFEPGVASFQPRGVEQYRGRPALRYDYEVAWENSAYRISNPPHEEVVAFRGYLLADAATFDLLRLEVLADEIPPEIGLDSVSSVLDYGVVAIGDKAGILPKTSELTMIGLDGSGSRNRTTLGVCRLYGAESKLTFGEPGPAGGPEPEPARIAAGNSMRLMMELALDHDIALETAAPGDRIRAVLARPLRDGERLIAPEGSVALGRIVGLEKQGRPFDRYQVALEFHTLEAGSSRYECSATMADAGPAPGMLRQAKQLNPTFSRDRKPRMDILVRPVQRGQGVLEWDARRPLIRKAFKMRWLVEELK